MAAKGSGQENLLWVEISDFRPGIISQAKFAYGSGDNSQPVPYFASDNTPKAPGAAQASGTVGCIALPNGGLAPLPGIVKTVDSGYTPSLGGTPYINGAIIYPLDPVTVEIVYGIEETGGGNRKFQLTSYIDQSSTTHAITTLGPAVDTSGTGVSPLTGALTRVNPTTPTDPGQPCVAIGYTFNQDAGAIDNNWLYPDPTAPGSYSLFLFSPSYPAYVLTHQNRVVTLSLDNYPWVGGGTVFQTSETFNYTDPPNSDVMGAQDEVFVQEYPGGVGAWGSIQSGELFLVKNSGGAFIISGDLNNPIITFLGGVVPTNYTTSNAAQTVLGLVYGSMGQGVQAWQGGVSSQKLSNNLNDDFWELGTPNPIQFSCAAWGDWLAVTNGWVYDTINGGWWKLTDPGFQPLYYGPSQDGKGVWAVAASLTSPTSPVIAEYHHSAPVNTYSWMSYPLKETIDKFCVTRFVVIRAQGNGTVTIELEGLNDSVVETEPVTFTIDSIQPVLLRMATTVIAHDITVAIESVGASGGPAPVVYSVAMGYYEGQHLNAIT